MTAAAIAAFGQVVLIDLVLAADNAIVIGALAASLPPAQRRKVVLVGIVAALALRVGFALGAAKLMSIVGLVFVGGLLLLWVSWKMWQDLRSNHGFNASGAIRAPRGFWNAVAAVVAADVSMSLDNVLAVAGAARAHPVALASGLLLSVGLMGGAATVIARYIDRYRWIAYAGLATIVLVAGRMVWEGGQDFAVVWA